MATFEDRRRAAVIDQLSRAVARMEKVQAKRFSVLDNLDRSVDALARAVRQKKRAPDWRRAPNYRLHGPSGVPDPWR